jgi:protein-disulfide isomerase
MKAYPNDVQIIWKNMPLDMHQKATPAAIAAEAAARQGKFWEMHDRIFADQANMTTDRYLQYARDLGLDVAKFKNDLESADVKARVEADKKEAAAIGVTGTPAFFVNGKFLSGAKPFEEFKKVIDQELGGS